MQATLGVAEASIVPPTAHVAASRPHLVQSIPVAIKNLPSTRYYGSKRILLPWIYKNIRGLKFNTALDIFGGSASVSMLLQLMRKSVTYHDGLCFNEDVARTLLSPALPMNRTSVVELLHSVIPREGVITRCFGGLFYTDDENRWLDGFMSLLEGLGQSNDAVSLLRYLVYQACLKKRPFNLFHRANLHLRTKVDVKRSFGNWKTWEHTFEEHMIQAFDELQGRIDHSGPAATILPSGNAEAIVEGYDLVYIDPPYVSESYSYNWDNYWRRYHFLEGLSRYSDWERMIDSTSAVRLLPVPRWMVEWSQYSTFQDRLFSLIEKHSKSIVVLSYITGAHPDEKKIRDFFKKTFSRVALHSKTHNHALSRLNKRELLFIGQPKR